MKNLYCFIGFAIMLFSSCDKESFTDFDQKSDTTTQVADILSFADDATYNHTVELLSEMGVDERNRWIKSNYGDFRSLYDLYLQSMEDASELDESMQSYMAYKKKYEKTLFFADYKDDSII